MALEFLNVMRQASLVILILTVSGCSPQRQAPLLQQGSKALSSELDSAKPEAEDEQGDTEGALPPAKLPPKVSIAELKASVKKEVKFVPSDAIKDPSFSFPQIAISLGNAEYVKILRCNASYTIETLTGESLKSLSGRPSAMEDLKYAWSSAIADLHNCQIIADYASSPAYTDLSTPNGSFYYIINPCVSGKRSPTKKDACSYAMELTEPFDYQNALKEELRRKTIELSRAQGTLEAHIQEVKNIASEIRLAIEYCENYFAMREAKKAWKSGLIMAGLLAGAGAIGFAVGGPNMAVMAGQMVMMMGSQMLIEKLNLAPQQDTCLTGEKNFVGKTNPFKNKRTLDRALAAARELDEKFGVVELFDRLEQLSKDDHDPQTASAGDGLISQAITKLSQIMQEMQQLDSRTVKLDSAIAAGNKEAVKQMKKSGIDISSLGGILGGMGGGTSP